MDAAHDTRRQLGQLMVEEGFLTEEQLAQGLDEQRRSGRPLGAVLVELGFVSAGAVGNALAEQHGGLLKTEFGISAGLNRASRPAPATPAPSRPAPAPPVPAAPAPAAAPDPLALRVRELESQLQAVLTERNAFAQKLNELNARLHEAAQAEHTEVARVTAAAAAHIDGLEAKLREAVASREELEAAARLAADRNAGLDQELAALRDQVTEPEDEDVAQEAPPEDAHLLFIPASGGYWLLERPGPAPASGALLDVDGLSFAVGSVGASPLPGSRLRCAFLARL